MEALGTGQCDLVESTLPAQQVAEGDGTAVALTGEIGKIRGFSNGFSGVWAVFRRFQRYLVGRLVTPKKQDE